MKNWLRFFCLGFFFHERAKDGAKRGYTNVFLSFILALVFLWAGFVGADMLPFRMHYANSPDFSSAAHAVLANGDSELRIAAEIQNGTLRARMAGGEYAECLLINTLESEEDRAKYSKKGYNIVIDTRRASALAEIEAYCVSNDGKNTVISYEDYLELSEVARLNFDFKLRYTGKELVLSDGAVKEYRAFADSHSAESKAEAARLSGELADGKITEEDYERAIYALYFTSYYPAITEYERSSAVPLLRNFYYHEYIGKGVNNYLFIFNDYMTGSFETSGGASLSFYGFFSNLEDGAVVKDGASEEEAREAVDAFITDAFAANLPLNAYAYAMNTITLAPFIALMLLVAALISYSTLRLRGVESISTLGATVKIVGSFVWFSGAAAAMLSMIAMFFAPRNLLNALPTVLFFAVLVCRCIIFIIKENKLYKEQLERLKAERTEV